MSEKEQIGKIESYPQPAKGKDEGRQERYRYIRYENAESIFFPDQIPLNTLVWVLLSKGRNKVPKLHQRARVLSEEPDGDGRILVQYRNKSTYRVRKKNLIPVFEKLDKLIIVASETNDYRRMSIVHTLPDDHFIEIGCDFGILVNNVDSKSALGIDKSEESIKIAKGRYPGENFLLGDVFDEAFELFPQKPLVVSIDINGNRELPAVIKCIKLVLDQWSPRLIMVKSRELHAKMLNDEQKRP